MRGYVVKKGKSYYAVIYEGIDPRTGKERRTWHAAGTRRGEAEKLVTELVKQRNEGIKSSTDRMTFGSYLVDRWLPIQESRTRPSTYLSYSSTVRLHVVPHVGRIRLDKLQANDLDGLYRDLLRSGNRRGNKGGGLSATSVRYVHRVINKALSDAVRKGAISRNVAELADPPKRQAPGTRTKIQVWDAPDLARFLGSTSEHHYHDLLVVAARTGMRRGEVMGLRWSDIDLEAATLSVRRAVIVVGWKIHVSNVKTGSGRRTIDIGKQVIKVLKARLLAQQKAAAGSEAGFDRHGLVFGRPDGEPEHPEYVTRAFDRLVARHKLPRIRFHDIRHTHATLLLKKGVPAKVVAERLGHASAGFTLNVYQHVIPGMQAHAAEVFDDLLDADSAPAPDNDSAADDTNKNGDDDNTECP